MDGKKSSFAKYIIASIAALMVIGVTITTVIIKSNKKDQPVVQPSNDGSDVSSDVDKDKSSVDFSSDKDTSSHNVSSKQGKKDTSDKETEKQTTTKAAVSFPIDVNTADKEAFCAIDGVGEYLAGQIISYRSEVKVIHSVDQLIEVDGIGKKTLEHIRSYLYVSDDVKQVYTTTRKTTSSKKKTVSAKPAATKQTTVKTSSTKQTITEEMKVLKSVNINTASAQEIADSLLITTENAQKIVDMREKIHKYSTKEEILLTDAVTQDYFNQIKDYILV
ncbi:helix-hairpin-helix domain-containing protein [Ruminococcus sp. FC2018]|uniref:helix-hairpin-helix domain-containing protein n=1 Tax=Ruminococcus sp. FC2018 TaxID=1410617 RepID=UPI00048D9B6D|nr:helix-hairpin-helix domain-containing protein [Ruminococcus sp. FC2018]